MRKERAQGGTKYRCTRGGREIGVARQGGSRVILPDRHPHPIERAPEGVPGAADSAIERPGIQGAPEGGR